uniref:Peptidoglycan recognition protein 2 n=1 Tax=Nephotettix cincticeps TaxID=94400 RepID=A0A5H2WVI9_NEPCI|nr:peptidoglycan recognition protein 2 [Nephotettix cincticeps]
MVGLTRSQGPGSASEDPQMFVVTRKQWNAHPPGKKTRDLSLPVANIRFTHTGTSPCGTFDECKKTLKKIQFEHMDTLGHNDICHNFMIGGQGWVFEGRGWSHEPDMPSMYSEGNSQSLQIAYIGDFEDEAPPPELLKAAMEIVVYITRKRMIFHFFKGIHLN